MCNHSESHVFFHLLLLSATVSHQLCAAKGNESLLKGYNDRVCMLQRKHLSSGHVSRSSRNKSNIRGLGLHSTLPPRVSHLDLCP